IFTGEKVSAVMVFFMLEAREEDEHLVLLISTVAAQFGSVIARKQTEEALRESEQRFRTLVNSMDDVIFLLGRDQRYLGVYGRWLEKHGYSVEHFLGKTPRDLFGAEGAEPHAAANLRALAG